MIQYSAGSGPAVPKRALGRNSESPSRATVVGTSMAVDDTGAALGSVAGGCVEGALYELCSSVLEGAAPGVQEFGVTDEDVERATYKPVPMALER